MLKDFISQRENFYIYGAQVIAYGAFTAIRQLWGKTPAAFLVSSRAGNPTDIEGIPVRPPRGISTESPVVVAVTELLQREIVTILQAAGFNNIFCLAQHEEHLLMAAYFRSIGKFPLAVPSNEPINADFVLYEVKNHRDKPLASPPQLREFERAIQAGAALTGEQLSVLNDNTGDNISAKNKQYCEMTATYWVWKNTRHAWKGIEHYRRHLLVTPSLLTKDTDVILPLPYVCYPHTMAQFGRFVGEDVVRALHHSLQMLHPREYDGYKSILYGKYQYTYNLLCAREQVFNDYCAWFFRITAYMEKLGATVPALSETRALSYVAEVLTNLYFMSRQNVWRVRHTEKAIYV